MDGTHCHKTWRLVTGLDGIERGGEIFHWLLAMVAGWNLHSEAVVGAGNPSGRGLLLSCLACLSLLGSIWLASICNWMQD